MQSACAVSEIVSEQTMLESIQKKCCKENHSTRGVLPAWQGSRRRVRPAPDQPDNRILECALAGSTGAVMTGDRAMLALEEFRGVRFLSLVEYVG